MLNRSHLRSGEVRYSVRHKTAPSQGRRIMPIGATVVLAVALLINPGSGNRSQEVAPNTIYPNDNHPNLCTATIVNVGKVSDPDDQRSADRRSIRGFGPFGLPGRSASFKVDVRGSKDALVTRYEKNRVIKSSWDKMPFNRSDTVPLSPGSNIRTLALPLELNGRTLRPYILEGDVDIQIAEVLDKETLELSLISQPESIERSHINFIQAAPRPPPLGDLPPNAFTRDIYVVGNIKSASTLGSRNNANFKVRIFDLGPTQEQFSEYYNRASFSNIDEYQIFSGHAEAVKEKRYLGALGEDLSYWSEYPTGQQNRRELFAIKALYDPSLLTNPANRLKVFSELGIEETSLERIERLSRGERIGIKTPLEDSEFTFKIGEGEFRLKFNWAKLLKAVRKE